MPTGAPGGIGQQQPTGNPLVKMETLPANSKNVNAVEPL